MVVFKRETFQNSSANNKTNSVPQCHVEYYFESPITVFREEQQQQQQSEGNNASEAGGAPATQLSFAAQIASVKGVCMDTTPFYVMEVGRIKSLIELWFHALPRVRPFYSIGCNSDPVLLRLLSEHPSIGFNCSTAENLQAALEVVGDGNDGQQQQQHQLLYSNPCLTKANLYQAASTNTTLVSFQSEKDLHRVMCYHPEAELILNVCVNLESEDPNALLGCPFEEAPEILKLAQLLGVRVVGVGFNVGSDCSRPETYVEGIRLCAQLAPLAQKFSVLSVGGGFASPSTENSVDFQQMCAQINMSLEYFFPQQNHPELQIIATPGRFFAGGAYSLITNIVDRKSVDASFITNNDFDAGNEAFLYQINDGYYGSFGCKVVTKCEPTCTPLFGDEMDSDESERVYGNVLGPFGFDSDFDVVQTGVRFRPLRVGDWLIWSNMGAYTFNNYGSLDDEDDESGRSGTPTVFYFSSQNDWDTLSENARRRKSMTSAATESDGEIEMTLLDKFSSSEDDDEGIGSGFSSAGEEEPSVVDRDRGANRDTEETQERRGYYGNDCDGEDEDDDDMLSVDWPLYN